jgi:hypothetical protein
MRFKLFFSIIFVVSVLASCAVFEPVQRPPENIERPSGPLPPSTRPTYNLSGYPPATREGYIDGCETAKQSEYGFKDKDRYESDGQYRMGWDDGFDLCRDKK